MAPRNGSSTRLAGLLPAKLLLVARCEDAAVRELRGVLREAGYEVLEASCTEVAINALESEALAAMLAELRRANLDGMRLLEVAKRRNPEVCAIMLLAGQQDLELASEAMRQGAYDFQLRPFHYPKLLAVLRRALEHQHLACENSTLQGRLYRKYGVEAITGNPPRWWPSSTRFGRSPRRAAPSSSAAKPAPARSVSPRPSTRTIAPSRATAVQ